MKTILKIAGRDLLNSKGFTFLFIFNLFLGICGFVGLHTFRDNVNSLLEGRAKQLLSADITVSARRKISKTELNQVKDVLGDALESEAQALGLYSMAKGLSSEGRSRLANLRGVESSHPFYGKIELDQERNYQKAMEGLQNKNHIWLDPALLRQLRIEIGDQVKIGNKVFIAAATIGSDSGSSWGGVGLAPKIYISKKNLQESGLISFGSVVSYAHLYKLAPKSSTKEKLEEIEQKLKQTLEDPALNIRAPNSASEQVGRALNYLSDYLGLVGLVALFLAGIGAGYLFQNYLFEKLQDVGILKSVGMGLGAIFSIYLFQLIVLNAAAVFLANGLAYFALPALSQAFFEWIKLEGELALTQNTLWLSMGVSLGASLLICFPVLLKMLGKKTRNLFEGGQFFRFEFKNKDIALYLPLLLFMWGLAVAQAHSFTIGSVFTAALLIVVVFIALIFPKILSWGDNRILKKRDLQRPGSLELGLALRYFTRDRMSSTLSICALTIGVMLLSVIGQLETSLRGELLDDADGKPSLFLFDIQEEQKEGLEKLAQKEGWPVLNMSPMVRSRILKVNGKKFERGQDSEGFTTREEERSQRFRNRGVNLSYRSETNSSETIIEGRPFSGPFKESSDELPEISLEKRYAQRLDLEIGDTMTFDVLGIEVTGKVINLRKVRWTSFLPNFFIMFQPGAIDMAPKTFLAAMGEMSFDQSADAQDQIVESFPNISMVNVSELIEKIMVIFQAMALALSVMAGLCLTVGFFVLFAIVQNQLKKKYFEAGIQKVFGMRSSQLMGALLREYFLMASIACFIGLGFSLILGQTVSVMFFDGVWRVDLIFMAKVALGVLAVTGGLAAAAGKTFYSLKVRSLLR